MSSSFVGRWSWVVGLLVATLFAASDARASACCPVTQESCVARPNHPNPACQSGTQPYVKSENVGGPCTCCEVLCLFDCEACLVGPQGECTPDIATNSVIDLCDDIDNDCDGQTDEDGISVEVCDGMDNNCNGFVDEQFPFSVTCGGAGACAGSQMFTCENGIPDATPCVGATTPTVEVCDGMDNNCNGSVDEQFPFSVTCGGAGACAGSQTFTCVDGVPGATACVGVTPPTTEVLDGYDNDCDGQTDECDGPNDFWCSCAGGEVTYIVDRLDDGDDAEAEAQACLPGAQGTGNCRLRGVFRRAEQLDQYGCAVRAVLPVGSIVINDELQLRHGELTLEGTGTCSTEITTQSPCAKGDCLCANASPHRLVTGIRDGGFSLALTVEQVTLRGGRRSDTANGYLTAGGGILIKDGDLTVRSAVIEDNRTRGLGSGIAVIDGGILTVEDSVIRDNFNLQAVANEAGCPTTQDAGGQTGMGGGILALSTAQVFIRHSVISGNAASDGGGIYAVGTGSLSIANSTISGNRVGGNAGGFYSGYGSTTLEFSTVTKNTSGGDNDVPVFWAAGFRVASGTLSAHGNLLSQNYVRGEGFAPPTGHSQDCSIDAGVVVTAGQNFIGHGGSDCAALGPTSSPLIGPDPGFPLGLQAGLVALPEEQCPTSFATAHGLSTSSPARNAYPANATPACPIDDQRHYGRPALQCTFGAIEPAAGVALRRIDVTSCTHAAQALTVFDRAEIDGDAYAGSFTLGSNAAVFGTVLARGAGSLGSGAIVDGDAALKGTLSGNTAGVLGQLKQQVAVPAQTLAARTFTSGGSGVTVAGNTTRPLAPGSYGALIVRSRGTLKLTQSGVYRFTSVTFEPDAVLDLAAGVDDVSVAAAGNATFGDRFRMGSGGQSTPNMPSIFVYSNGSRIDVGHDATLVANLEAPAGLVELKDRSVILGCAAGKNVTIRHDAVVGDGLPAVVPLPPWPAAQ
jgi:hypothetical protein